MKLSPWKDTLASWPWGWICCAVILVIGLGLSESSEKLSAVHKSTISSQAYTIMDLRNRLGDVYGTTISESTKWQSIEVTATAYSARKEETDNTPHETSTGELTICGIIAVSQDLVALGMVPGKIVLLSAPSGSPIGAFRIADRMHSRWRHRIDLLAGNTLAATLYGQRRVVVTWPN